MMKMKRMTSEEFNLKHLLFVNFGCFFGFNGLVDILGCRHHLFTILTFLEMMVVCGNQTNIEVISLEIVLNLLLVFFLMFILLECQYLIKCFAWFIFRFGCVSKINDHFGLIL